jgi:hypothetical protein
MVDLKLKGLHNYYQVVRVWFDGGGGAFCGWGAFEEFYPLQSAADGAVETWGGSRAQRPALRSIIGLNEP